MCISAAASLASCVIAIIRIELHFFKPIIKNLSTQKSINPPQLLKPAFEIMVELRLSLASALGFRVFRQNHFYFDRLSPAHDMQGDFVAGLLGFDIRD